MKFNSSNKVYAHVDCNSFFASCEALRNPILKGKCVCVGWDIIVAASYEAKAYWIKTWTPIWEARRILGDRWIFINSDLAFYKTVSDKLMIYLKTVSIDMQIFSIDEAFIDITWIPDITWQDYKEFAISLKKNILKIIWIPVSIWVANTKIKAKIFGDINKPFWELVAFEDNEISNILKKLKPWDIPFIGKKLSERLEYICKTADDFRRLSFWKVDEILWKCWTDLWLELNWIDVMNFVWLSLPKSISRTSSFNKKITNNKDFLWWQIIINFNKAYSELVRYNLESRVIVLYLRDKELWKYFFEYKLGDFTIIRSDILLKVRELFFSKVDFSLEYRTTWIFLSDFRQFKPKQLSMDDIENRDFEKNLKVNQAISDLNKKYSKKIVNFGI